MSSARYSVRIGESHCIAENVTYDALLERIVEFTVRAAAARTIDQSEWEHEELRRKGLGALQIFRNERAIWENDAIFEAELEEARRERVCTRFKSANELNAEFYAKLDADLRVHWRHAGYAVPTLREDMKPLFLELERDMAERAETARETLLGEILAAGRQESL